MTLAVEDFRVRTVMPSEDIDELESRHPGYLDAALKGALSEIYSRLRKRYRTPMVPVPEIVMTWQAQIVTPRAYRARGANPQDPALAGLDADAQLARDQMKEAADAENGLYDLPLLETADGSAIAKSGPLGTSEQSPYDWIDAQSEVLRGR